MKIKYLHKDIIVNKNPFVKKNLLLAWNFGKNKIIKMVGWVVVFADGCGEYNYHEWVVGGGVID